MGPKMHEYAHFVDFGGPINSVIRPKKRPNVAEI